MPSAATQHTYLVEHYRPGLAADSLEAAAAQIREHVGATTACLCSVIVPAEESILLVLRASSEKCVVDAYRRTGATFDRISVVVADITPRLPAQPTGTDARTGISGSSPAPPSAPSIGLTRAGEEASCD